MVCARFLGAGSGEAVFIKFVALWVGLNENGCGGLNTLGLKEVARLGCVAL